MSSHRCVCLVSLIMLATCANAAQPIDPGSVAKLSPTLVARLADEGVAKTWVFFADKGLHSPTELSAALEDVAATYDKHAIERRAMRGTHARNGAGVFNQHDVPVVESYLDAVTRTGARLHVTSRWLNAISVYATVEQAELIATLPFVNRLEAVARSRRIEPVDAPKSKEDAIPVAPLRMGGINYGRSAEQLQQINLPALHAAGYTGHGVVIGILDTGFERSHIAFNHPIRPLTVIAEYDFVDNDGNAAQETGDPYSQHEHGTMILGCIGSYAPGDLVGGAFNASFVLAKTEDTTGEYPAEEDNYVAGLEFLESHGVDCTTSSLGYIDWYTQADLDGQTAVTTIAINILTSLGVHHCNAAGNEYHDSNPTTSSLIAPADGFQVITCGAVSSSGTITSFSSDGPTADGRIKPEVLALGSGTDTVNPFSTTGYTTADGTSLSTPLVACAVACLTQARPYWTVDQMREHLFETSQYYVLHGTHDPLYVYGYGIIDAFAANDVCDDAGAAALDSPKYACTSTATITVNDCGLDQDHGMIETVTVAIDSDSETGVEQVVLTELAPDAATFEGAISLSTVDAAGVLLIAEGDTITVTYIDADNGQGGQNIVVTAIATVDCAPPMISNIQTVNIGPRDAYAHFETDEPTLGIVHYGVSCGALNQAATSSGYGTTHEVHITGLDDDHTYYYAVEAADEAGNSADDDNGGSCYSFTTPETPDFFTEEFLSGFDLDGLTITFTPTGGSDFYTACAEEIDALPSDPTGGANLPLSDDDSETVTIAGGQNVALYGTTYTAFFVNSNGNITFGVGDTDYTESLEEHFDLPRLSALFDDLNPNSGGTVSYRQFANRIVVTWQNVPEYSATGSNTFQVELYFDGTITFSYLGVTSADSIVGLSAGEGLSPDYLGMDLSALGGCGLPGDLDCDGDIDFDDIDPFVLALSGQAGYEAEYPDCNWMNADTDGDGAVDFDDIDPFVALLAG